MSVVLNNRAQKSNTYISLLPVKGDGHTLYLALAPKKMDCRADRRTLALWDTQTSHLKIEQQINGYNTMSSAPDKNG